MTTNTFSHMILQNNLKGGSMHVCDVTCVTFSGHVAHMDTRWHSEALWVFIRRKE